MSLSEPNTPPTPPVPGFSPSGSGSMKRSSYAKRHDINGTVVTEGDLGNGMSTVRPVRRIDTAGSQRASVEFVGSIRERPESPVSPTASTTSSGGGGGAGSKLRNKLRNQTSKEDGVGTGVSRKGQAGRDLVDEVVLPVVQRSIHEDMSAHSLEALEMISKGFHTLKTSDPELAYSVIADLLAGIHENEPLRQHINSISPSPFTLIRRTAHRNEEGKLVVTEHEEETSVGAGDAGAGAGETKEKDRSPIADMLYMRWMEGLKIRWPGGG
ncbi:hypothetical protein BDY24DRAFT_150289 [Mrakia frigida]|uniref:uncharacterized protein n=1 Tax=Mrakia frigida TaxID=29902 RepID=UPI003FCC035C